MKRRDVGKRRLGPDASPTRSDKKSRDQRNPAIRKNLAVHFSSKTGVWETPKDFFDTLDDEFGFDVDVCALPENAKCSVFYSPDVDGLKQVWTGVCFMNPPYGREIQKWVKKAYESAKAGATVVCLLPSRTDTGWWANYVMEANEVRFVRGRLRFVGAEHSAPFPSAVVVFRPWFTPTVLKTAV